MDGSWLAPEAVVAGPSDLYEGPPDHRTGQRHAVYPDLTHDEIERYNYLAQMNRLIATRIAPTMEAVWTGRVEPKFRAEQARAPKDRHDVRKALLTDPLYQTWSALRRATMEQRQEAGRWVALRQAETLAARADALIDDQRLTLDAGLELPRYVTQVHHHCAPGSYYTEAGNKDVSGPASYDSGIHVTVGGRGGPLNDGIGRAIAEWLKTNMPAFKPRRILDLGVTLGHNLLPIAQAFPDAEVIGVDVGAPVLRYGAARARALGVDNVRFVQADAADLARFEDGGFDFVMSTMFLHELSLTGMRDILKEARRLLAPGGLMLNMEQPNYKGMGLFEQAQRDWDSFYNNEPFWTTLHGLDMDAEFMRAGFDGEKLVNVEIAGPPAAAVGASGRKVSMVFVGGRV